MNTVVKRHEGQSLFLSAKCKTEPGSHMAFVPCSACHLAGFNKETGQFENCEGTQVTNPDKG